MKKIIPLGLETKNRALIKAKKLHPRRQNWSTPKAVESQTLCFEILTKNHGKYSSRCTFNRKSYPILVDSYYEIIEKTVVWSCFDRKGKVTAPFGYHWVEDNIGLALAADSDDLDYHPDSDDIKKGARFLASKIREKRMIRIENRKKQRKEKLYQKQVDKIKKTGFICLKDSLKAGNCRTGTINFCKKHGLNIFRHYRISEIEKIKEYNSQLSYAIEQAVSREIAEQKQGFSELINHRV